MLSGASVRYRFYTRWGVTAEELSRIVFSYSVTFWLGLFALGGLSLVVSPLPDGARPARARTAAGRRRLAPHAAAASPICWRPSFDARHCAFGRFELPLPSPRLALAQVAALGASSGRWPAPCSTCCCPRARLSFLPFLGAFLVAILLGMVEPCPRRRRRVRGADGPAPQAVPDVGGSCFPRFVVYRAVYYLLPLTIALIVLGRRRGTATPRHVARVGAGARAPDGAS